MTLEFTFNNQPVRQRIWQSLVMLAFLLAALLLPLHWLHVAFGLSWSVLGAVWAVVGAGLAFVVIKGVRWEHASQPDQSIALSSAGLTFMSAGKTSQLAWPELEKVTAVKDVRTIRYLRLRLRSGVDCRIEGLADPVGFLAEVRRYVAPQNVEETRLDCL